MRRPLCLTFPILLLVATANATERVERSLVRPVPAVDPDARGRLRMERSNPGEQRFEITIEEVAPLSEIYSLWMEEPAGSMNYVALGNFLPDRADRATFLRDTSRGDALPLDVMTLEELDDRLLEVRDGMQMPVLLGRVPPLQSPPGTGSNFQRTERRNPLLRPTRTAPFIRARGTIEVERAGFDSRLVISTRFWDVVSTTSFLWMEDEFGILQDLGPMDPVPNRYNGLRQWSSLEGDPFPFGVTDASQLAGRRVEIRDEFREVLVKGQIPDLLTATGRRKTRSELDPTTTGIAARARGKLQARWQLENGRFRLEVEARAVTEDETAALFMENPTTGAIQEVARAAWRGAGKNKRATWRWRSDRGSALPFGVTDTTELLGLDIEIRDGLGQVLLRGTL